MDTSTDSPIRDVRYRSIAYWSATALVAAELGLGGIWPRVCDPQQQTRPRLRGTGRRRRRRDRATLPGAGTGAPGVGRVGVPDIARLW